MGVEATGECFSTGIVRACSRSFPSPRRTRSSDLLHVLAAICAFGPLFLYPRMHRAGETQAIAKLHMRFVVPGPRRALGARHGHGRDRQVRPRRDALGDRRRSSCGWSTLLVSWFLIRPSISDTSEAAGKKMNAGIGVTHLTLIVGALADDLPARRHDAQDSVSRAASARWRRSGRAGCGRSPRDGRPGRPRTTSTRPRTPPPADFTGDRTGGHPLREHRIDLVTRVAVQRQGDATETNRRAMSLHR